MLDLDEILPRTQKPARYCGSEFNVVRKEWDKADFRMVLAFPDLYEIGMSHEGLKILYHIINNQPGFLAERVYAPDLDLEKILRKQATPLFSLESRRPLADFDVLGITLPFELCYANILTILDLARIPFRAAERDETYPLIIGGGPCAFHPEPVADFFDAILLGDGEEAILEIAETVKKAKADGVSKEELRERLAAISGIYVPAFFVPEYDGAGRFVRMKARKKGYHKVQRRILADLDVEGEISPPLVPANKIVHDRLGIEIARGCTRGCRFCQAGIVYRPVRERAPDRILEIARQKIGQSGFEELALLSLSTGDYACLPQLLTKLMDIFAKEHVSVSMPSMRVGTLTPEIMDQIRRVRKTGFTLAPEAGTDRLRRVINKGITEEDLLATCKTAFSLGWRLIKLYFMFGLPTETADDIEAIPVLARKALGEAVKGGCRINVSAATFVPKPHTAFEREPQLTVAEGFDRIGFLRDRLRGKAFNLKWHDPRQSYLEGVLSRGDRRLAAVVEEAWRLGARLDAWSDYFRLDRWQQAASACGIDFDAYLGRRAPDEPLPWQHLDVGVSGTFFADEYDKAMNEVYTPDCRVHGCQKCGVCDLKTIKPIVKRGMKQNEEGGAPEEPLGGPAGQEKHFIYRFTYSRLDEARFLSHLALIQVFFRAFRRCKLPLHFSKGFNPTPKVSFSPALPLGTESVAEFLQVDLAEPLPDRAAVLEAVNRQLPMGLKVTAVALAAKKQKEKNISWYRVSLKQGFPRSVVEDFHRLDSFPVTLVRKGRARQIDAKPVVHELTVTDDGKLYLAFVTETGKAGIKPMEFCGALFALDDEQVSTARIVKVKSEEL